MKIIHHDALMPFGKYRGRSPEEIMRSDPSYFAWLHGAGIATGDAVITDFMIAWSKNNPKEYHRALESGKKYKGGREPMKDVHSEPPVQARPPMPPPPPVVKTEAVNSDWGSW